MLQCSWRMTGICWPPECASTNGLNLVALQPLKWEVISSHCKPRAVGNAQALVQLIQPCGKQCGSTWKLYAEEVHPHKCYGLELTVQQRCFLRTYSVLSVITDKAMHCVDAGLLAMHSLCLVWSQNLNQLVKPNWKEISFRIESYQQKKPSKELHINNSISKCRP